MDYSNCFRQPTRDYSPLASQGLDNAVNKFYINIGSVNVNNGIQHSIAAERLGDVNVYNQTIDNRIGVQHRNYIVNLDNRKIEFISPYTGLLAKQKYLEKGSSYLLPAPAGTDAAGSQPEYQSMITTGLLKPRRPPTQFVEAAYEIKGLVTDTFEKLTGQQFPDDILVSVCDEEEMKRIHEQNGGKWNRGIMGFAINRQPDTSAIFIKQNDLDALMLTVGHEIGHVLSNRIKDDISEEAKAFAFELAWAKTIVENDIGGLAANFNVNFMPAENGLHDRAFAFVQKEVKMGKEALRLFFELAKGVITVNNLYPTST